jgi:adenine deaminase
MAVLERHKNTGHTGLGFLGGYGLKRGAVATSIAHDSHNLIIAGTNDRDMALAGNTVRKNQGGIAVVADGAVLSELALPIGGLMSPESAIWVDERLERLKIHAYQLGIGTEIDPFMTLAFASLPVIPMLRLNTCGLIDVQRQEVVKTIFSSTLKNTSNQ